MPITFHKELDEITGKDITDLITNQVRENLNLEYKEMMYGSGDEETREKLRDITSMANAHGGHILIGVKEDGQNEGIPITCEGIEDAEAASARITSSCLSNIDERIPGLQIHPVPLSNGKHIIVIRIPKSPRAPHMITFKGLYQFWKRHDRQKSRMSVDEIKEACNATEQLMARTEEFVKHRKTEVNQRIPFKRPFYYLTATPYFIRDEVLDIYDPKIRSIITDPADQRIHGFNVMCDDHANPTLHGLISEIPGIRSLEIFRNGHCELIVRIEKGTFWDKAVERYPILNPMALVEYVVSFVRFYKHVLEFLNIIEPVIVSVSLFNILEFGLYDSPNQVLQSDNVDGVRGPKIWREPNLEISPKQVISFEFPDKVAREFTDRIWNAFGYEKSPYFDSNHYCTLK